MKQNRDVCALTVKSVQKLVDSFEPKGKKPKQALQFAEVAHKGVKRKSGEPFINHTIAVAAIINRCWGIDCEDMISAALLHDVIEDTAVSREVVNKSFGKDVADLVEGVSKFSSEKVEDAPKEVRDWKDLQKFLKHSFLDPRVAVIKLSDRLHNMLTIDAMPPEKRRLKAQETATVYAKLAMSLGMWSVMNQLRDISLMYLFPKDFTKLSKIIEKDPRLDEKYINKIQKQLLDILNDKFNLSVEPRINGHEALRQKLEKTAGNRSTINDLVSFRVKLDTTDKTDCYKAIGVIHEHFAPLVDMKRYDDFIVNVRDNGYSCLQTTLNLPEGATEIAVATEDMEEFNQWGIVHLIRKGESDLEDFALKLVFDEEGRVHFFRKEATGIDVAYGLGGPNIGAKAQKIVLLNSGEDKELSLSGVIPNAVKVRIITSHEDRIAPNKKIMKSASMATVRTIKEQLQQKDRSDYQKRGRAKLRNTLVESGRGFIEIGDLPVDLCNEVLKQIGVADLTELYYSIGFGSIRIPDLIKALNENGATKKDLRYTTLWVSGPDQPWVLKDMVNWLYETVKYDANGGADGKSGNIEKLVHEPSTKRNSYELRFVIKDLPKKAEEMVRKKVSKDERFSSWVVV